MIVNYKVVLIMNDVTGQTLPSTTVLLEAIKFLATEPMEYYEVSATDSHIYIVANNARKDKRISIRNTTGLDNLYYYYKASDVESIMGAGEVYLDATTGRIFCMCQPSSTVNNERLFDI